MIDGYRNLATKVLLMVVDDFKEDIRNGRKFNTAWERANNVNDVWFEASGINREWFYKQLKKGSKNYVRGKRLSRGKAKR